MSAPHPPHPPEFRQEAVRCNTFVPVFAPSVSTFTPELTPPCSGRKEVSCSRSPGDRLSTKSG